MDPGATCSATYQTRDGRALDSFYGVRRMHERATHYFSMFDDTNVTTCAEE